MAMLGSLMPSGLYTCPRTLAKLAPAREAEAPRGVVAHSAAEKKKVALYSPEYYTVGAIGGVVACGVTHMLVTPLDVVKCNMQTDPQKYKSIMSGFSTTVKEGGMGGLVRGWEPTLLGYAAQGSCKFGLYEFFKKYYQDTLGPEKAAQYKTPIFLVGSASAEFIADIALCPFEAVKVKMQTTPGYPTSYMSAFPKFVEQNGWGGLFKGLTPLWGRQIPYTMMKFACFENTVNALYQYVVPKPKDECTKGEKTAVSFAAGYIAGVFCAIVSHPADNLVSKLNASADATTGSVIKEMGIVGLMTRGLPLRIVMIGTLTGLQWSIYDAFKLAAGLPSTGSKK